MFKKFILLLTLFIGLQSFLPEKEVKASSTSDSLIFTIDTTKDPSNRFNTFSFTGSVSGNARYSIDWGDGTVENNRSGTSTHNYGVGGVYVITITKTLGEITFTSTSHKTLITGITSFGDIGLLRLSNSILKGAINLTTVPDFLPLTVTKLDYAFHNLTDFNDPNISNWDVSHVTNFNNMFDGATSFNQDISSWNVALATDLNSLFYKASSFNQPLNTWDISNVTSLSATFRDASSFDQPLSGWNTENVTKMDQLFNGATSFNQDISSWAVNQVTDMYAIFNQATSFNQPLNSWQTSSVTTLSSAFSKAVSFNQPLNNWNVSNVVNLFATFKDTTAFNQDLSNWDTSNVTTMSNLFSGSGFNQSILDWNTSKVENMSSMFSNSSYNLDLSTLNVANALSLSGMFYNNTAFNQNINDWNTSNVTDMSSIFSKTTAYDQPIDQWDTSSVKYMSGMFEGSVAFNQSLANLNTSNVTNFDNMFKDSVAFNQDLTNFDVSKATKLDGVFQNSVAFNGDISNWNISNVTRMVNTFAGSMAFNSDISNWDVSNVTQFDQMFKDATAFNQGLSGWDFSSAQTLYHFYQTPAPALTPQNFSSIIDRLVLTLPTLSNSGQPRVIHFSYMYSLRSDAQIIYNLTSTKNWRIEYKGPGYTIQFVDHDGTVISEHIRTQNEKVSAPEGLTRTGYTFRYYVWAQSYLNPFQQYTLLGTNDITFVAEYERNTYNIVFETNGGTFLNNKQVNYDIAIEAASFRTTTKENFIFDGWYEDALFTIPLTRTNMPANDLVLYAKWNPVPFKISFYSSQASYVPPIYAYENDPISAPTPPTKNGFTFLYWMQDIGGAPYVFDTMPNKNINLLAIFERGTFNINYETNGGLAIPKSNFDFETNITALQTPVKSGHIFEGWYLDSSLTQPFDSFTMPSHDVTVYAEWSIASYTLTFITNGSNPISPITQAYNTVVTMPTPTRTGYTFDGFYSDLTLTSLLTITTMPAKDTTVYLKWSINTYTLTFDTNGGSAISPITEAFDTVLTVSNPTKTGYTFEGFYKDILLTNSYAITNMPAEDITLYAKWSILRFEIKIMDSDDIVYQNEFNLDALLPTDILPLPKGKIGHTFNGWSGTLPTNMPEFDIVINAIYVVNNYTLTFDTNGGSAISPITEVFDTVLTVSNPTRTGYTFEGFYKDILLTNSYTIKKYAC